MRTKTTYTISEYNMKTKKYKELGEVAANTAREARAIFIEQNKWKKRRGFSLLVQLPICR